jgi:hypothetical protein
MEIIQIVHSDRTEKIISSKYQKTPNHIPPYPSSKGPKNPLSIYINHPSLALDLPSYLMTT